MKNVDIPPQITDNFSCTYRNPFGEKVKHAEIWAINSVGECYLDKVEVVGSNPISPTKLKSRFVKKRLLHFYKALQ